MQDNHSNPLGEASKNERTRTGYRRAITISVLFHLLLLAVLWRMYMPVTRTASQSATTAASSQSERLEERERVDGSEESRVAARAIEPREATPKSDPIVPAAQIDASIQSQIDAVQRLSDERKLSELEKNLARLESISTPQSVQRVTSTIAGTLGLQPGPTPREQPPAGDLDFDTAQLHDVTRVRGEQGQWEYASILVDSQGRTQTVPLTVAEGETAYQTFEQLKRYPMADGIYRQLVMPMIQQMIAASELAEKAAQVSRELQEDSANRVDDPAP
jgi:hypothetical protein